MDKMLGEYREKVKGMTEEEFKVSRDSVLTNISEKDKNLREDYERMFNNEISTHRY